MKKALFFGIFFMTFFSLHAQNTAAGRFEIRFSYKRQSGFSSNQFALWVEDSGGNFVRTLYATRFTAGGGWKRRPLSLPLWTRKSGLSTLSKEAADAVSGATPRTGSLSYTWDGRDKDGRVMGPGEYRIFLEATLKEDNRVLYSAPFTLGEGGPVEAELKPEYSGSRTNERDMIGEVRISYGS